MNRGIDVIVPVWVCKFNTSGDMDPTPSWKAFRRQESHPVGKRRTAGIASLGRLAWGNVLVPKR